MIDIKLIRENPDLIKKDLKKRKEKEKLNWLIDLIKKDKESNQLKTKIDQLRHKRNTLSKQINEQKKQNKNISKLLKEVKTIPNEIKKLEENHEKLKEKIKYYLLRLPNLTHKSVPYGRDDSNNVEIKKWGKISKPKFQLKPHGEIIEEYNLGDFKKASEVSGTGFHYLKNDLAHLNLALMQFAIDFLTKKGYQLFIPPLMLRKKPYEGVTDLEDFKNVMYKIEDEDLYMIATSEHPIAAYHMNETIKDLPVKIVAMSPCFRKEIGSHGIDTKGLFRIHQFWKVEQFIFCKPEDSWKYHEELQKNSEELYKKLKIPFRVTNICTGDLGIVAAKKFDIEAWFPRQQTYKEVGSNSNCTDYQARRLNIKYIDKYNKRVLVHTLNNTAIATSRTMVAILENYQQKDKIKIPKVLQPYMYNKKEIKNV